MNHRHHGVGGQRLQFDLGLRYKGQGSFRAHNQFSQIEDVFLQQGIEVVSSHAAHDLRETAGNLFSVLF